jgi:hypothetical protein
LSLIGPTHPKSFCPNERRILFAGRELPISIDVAHESELSPLEREAVRLAESFTPSQLAASAPAVVQNYEVYRERLEDELPLLARPADVWRQVRPAYVEVPNHADYDLREATVMLYAECDWDTEHGLEVRFRNGRADAANQQGELGPSD